MASVVYVEQERAMEVKGKIIWRGFKSFVIAIFCSYFHISSCFLVYSYLVLGILFHTFLLILIFLNFLKIHFVNFLETFGNIWAYVVESKSTGQRQTERVINDDDYDYDDNENDDDDENQCARPEIGLWIGHVSTNNLSAHCAG